MSSIKVVSNLHLYGVAAIAVIPLNLIACYVTSVFMGSVYPFIPFPSDTGSYPPASCVFSSFMNGLAIVKLVNAWIRHQQVDGKLREKSQPVNSTMKGLNDFHGCVDATTSVALLLIANIQISNGLEIHSIGAITFLITIMLSMFIQSFSSCYTDLCSPSVARFRVFSCLAQAAILVPPYAFSEFTGTEVAKWNPKDGGYMYHCLSALLQYMFIFNYLAFQYTVMEEYRKLSIVLPQVYFNPSIIKNKILGGETCQTCTQMNPFQSLRILLNKAIEFNC